MKGWVPVRRKGAGQEETDVATKEGRRIEFKLKYPNVAHLLS